MSDCGRPWGWGEEPGCQGCWATILEKLILAPGEMILPQPQMCQDAAYVAFTLDRRLKAIHGDHGNQMESEVEFGAEGLDQFP